MGSSPGQGRSHMPQSNKARAPQLLSLHSRAREPQLLRPARLEPMLCNKRSPRTTMKSSPCSPQLEKAHTQQRRPNAAKNKLINFKKRIWVNYKMQFLGLPWWRSGWESACQCRGYGFKPWSGKIPRAAEQLSPWATTTEPVRLEPVLRNGRGRDSERPAHCDKSGPRSPQLEKALAQKRRPNTAINKLIN